MRNVARSVAGIAICLIFAIPLFSIAATCKVVDYDGSGNYQIVGYDNNAERSATSFTVASDCTVTEVGLLLSKESSRVSEDWFAALYSDSSGSPGTIIEAGAVNSSGSILNYPTFVWASSTFAGTTQLNAGTTYWMVADTSLYENFIMVWGRGGAGTTKQFNGTSWGDGNSPSNTAAFTIDGTISSVGTVSGLGGNDIIMFDF